MTLTTFLYLKDDTRLILHKDTVYKVKVKYIDLEVIKNVNFPFTEEAANCQIEQVLRAVFYADERNLQLRPILTEHFLITAVKVSWKAARHFGFKKDETVLRTFPFVFEIGVRVRDEIVENVRNSTNKSANIQQPSKRGDKNDSFFQRRSNKTKKPQPNSVEDGSSTADPSSSNTAPLIRDEKGCFQRMIDGDRNMSPQEQLTTTDCIKKYKEILKKTQSKTDTQTNSEASVSSSNLESHGGSETLKPSSQTKNSQSPCKREITPQRRKSGTSHMPPKLRDDVSVSTNKTLSGKRKDQQIKLGEISKGDADLENEQSVKFRLSRKRCFDEKITESVQAGLVSMNKFKRTCKSSRTSETENLTLMSDNNSKQEQHISKRLSRASETENLRLMSDNNLEQEQHISKRLRSADPFEKDSLQMKVSQRNENSERDKALELSCYTTKSVHKKNHIKTKSSTGKSIAREDIKMKSKDNSVVWRKMVLKGITDSAQGIQTRSQRIAVLKKVENKDVPLNTVHKMKTQSQSEETTTLKIGLHRCDEGINAQSAISPRISHVKPFKSAKLDEKQNPFGSPLRNARNPSTSKQGKEPQRQEQQIGGETDRLLNLSLRNPMERRISNRRSVDRYVIEREELEETLKLQQLAQSTSPRRSSRQLAKKKTASIKPKSGIWNMMDIFLTPVKKLFKSE